MAILPSTAHHKRLHYATGERADELLKSLETEKNLYEMRQFIPLEHDVFGQDRKDIIEHWTENKLDEWRVQHRKREKEYRQKLAKLREKEETDVRTEEDLFKALNELEKLDEDEFYRLEAERKEFYDDLKDGEVYDESEVDVSDSDRDTTEIIQEELKKLKDIQMSRVTSETSSNSSNGAQDKILDTNATKNEQSHSSANFIQEKLKENLPELREKSEDTNTKNKRRISFAEPCVTKDESNTEEISISQEVCSEALKQNDTTNESSEDEDDTIRIKFSHSFHIPDIPESNNMEIQSPVDIYKALGTPKSILKRSPNDMIFHQVAPLNEDSSTDTEDEYVKHSAYNSVIKEKVQESKASPVNVTTKKNEKRTTSKFKLERAGKKK